jgi:uncharacterized protein
MRNVRQKLSHADSSALKTFLSNPDRPDGTWSFQELQGFLFAIACSPETVQPSEWIPLISNDNEIGFADESEAQRILGYIMTLYNEVNSSAIERSDALPMGCKFRPDILANFEEQSSISQWSRGFTSGHDWLRQVWEEYLPESLEDEYGAGVMLLSFFSSQQLAEAYYEENDDSEGGEAAKSFEQFAQTIRKIFPAGLAAYANLGRSIFEVHMRDAAGDIEPARSTKVSRNAPCPCGSGKKYKKCCGGTLH